MIIRDAPLVRLLRDWVESVRRYGPLYLAAYPFDLVRVQRTEHTERFDAVFGSDTMAIVYPWNLRSIRWDATPEVHAYEAAPASLIRLALDAIPLRPRAFTFVDLGSGKGRVLSSMPRIARRAVGVRLSAAHNVI